MIEYPVVHRQRRQGEGATDSAALNRVVFPWLEKHHNEPFFLFVHSTDPHAPYDPPDTTKGAFADAAEDAAFRRDTKKLTPGLRRYQGGALFNRRQSAAQGVDAERWVRRAADRYDAEIAHNDGAIERLAGKLEELGILDETLIIVVSDHGEEFLDHGWTTHGHSLYQELTKAVLLMWNPALLGKPRRLKEPVQMIDVAPTILDLLGIESPVLTQGQSLAALLRGQPFKREGPVMSSRLPRSGTRPAGGGVPENWTGTAAWFDPKWKLIYRDEGKRVGLNEVELFDRSADPGDGRDLARERPGVTAELLARVRLWLDGQKEARELLGSVGTSTLDKQTMERLRSLGYIGGAKPPK